jgi:hypothetical protein
MIGNEGKLHIVSFLYGSGLEKQLREGKFQLQWLLGPDLSLNAVRRCTYLAQGADRRGLPQIHAECHQHSKIGIH